MKIRILKHKSNLFIDKAFKLSSNFIFEFNVLLFVVRLLMLHKASALHRITIVAIAVTF